MYYFIYLLLLIYSIYEYQIAPLFMDKGFMCLQIAVGFLLMFLHFSKKENNKDLKKQFLRHSTIFLVCFAIIYWQNDIDYILGITHFEDNKYVFWDAKVVCSTLCVVNAGLTMFLLGYQMKSNFNRNQVSLQKYYNFRNVKILYYLFLILFIAYLLFVNKNYLLNGYGTHATEGFIASHISGYIRPVLFVIFVVRIYQAKVIQKGRMNFKDYTRFFKKPILFASLYMLIVFMSGRRTELVQIGLLVIASYLIVIHKVNYKMILFLFIGVAIILSLRAFTRASTAGNTISDAQQDFSNVSSIFPPTKELAFNSCSLHIAESTIPSEMNYLYGTNFFSGFLNLIPGLRDFILDNFTTLPKEAFFSDALLTLIGQGKWDQWGLGTSQLADIYISFGNWGIIIVMFFMGIFIRYCEECLFTSDNRSPYLTIMSISVYSNLIYGSRGAISTLFAGVGFCWILLMLMIRKNTITK